MNVMNILKQDLQNFPGISCTVWCSGCEHHCKGCFNQEAWDFDAGVPFDYEMLSTILDAVSEEVCDALVLLGGEPLHPNNLHDIHRIIMNVKQTYPDKKIWVYSGYTFEELCDRNDYMLNQCLKNIDVLIDGRFVESLKNPNLRFRGSSNQRVIDVPKTLDLHTYGKVVWVHTGDEPAEELPQTFFQKLKSKIWR